MTGLTAQPLTVQPLAAVDDDARSRNNPMAYILPVASILTSILFALVMLGLLIAGSPNSTPEIWARIKAWMIATTIATVVCIAAAGWGLVMRRMTLATGLAISPTLFVIIAFVILYRGGK